MNFFYPHESFSPLEWRYISNKPLPAEIIFKVGEPNFPPPGSSEFESPLIINRSVLIARNNLIQWSKNPQNGNSYFEHSGSKITFHGPLLRDEFVQIFII